jgi:ubiquinone/menaquinone biosynthesis C-methylase UbiE
MVEMTTESTLVNTQSNAWNDIAEQVNFTVNPNLDLFERYVHPRSTVLDYGCGYGRIANELRERGFSNVLGVDTSREMIRRGNMSFPQVNLAHITDFRIPAPDWHFDGVVVSAVLTCIASTAERQAVIDELMRVLKPAGIAYFVEFHASESNKYESDGTFASGLGVKMKHFTQEELEHEISGLRLLHSEIQSATTIEGHGTRVIHCVATKR